MKLLLGKFSVIVFCLTFLSCKSSHPNSSVVGRWVADSNVNASLRGSNTDENYLKSNDDGKFEGHLYNSQGFFKVAGTWEKSNDQVTLSFVKDGVELNRVLQLSRYLTDSWMPPYEKLRYVKSEK